MSVKLGNVLEPFAAGGVDHGNATLLVSPKGNIDSFSRRIISDIVGVLPDVDRIQQTERISVINPEFAVCTIRDEQPVELAYINQTLWVGCTDNAVYVLTGERIYDFDRVVAKGGANNPFAFSVEREVL